MRRRLGAALVAFALVVVGGLEAADRGWENPVISTEQEAVAAATTLVRDNLHTEQPAARMFVDLTLGEVGAPDSFDRLVVDEILVTHPRAFRADEVRGRTIERFLAEIPGQRKVLERRLNLFGYPPTRGLVYCRLVASVDAFAGLGSASSDKMSQVGGVTYYCRYLVLPLSYVGEQQVRELRRRAAGNPSLDVEGTIRRWQRESFASLVSTFRHELVHARTNSSLGVPIYSDRSRFPTWFHEGSATYLAADPHAGLSARYKEYQNLFFYLVQRHGVGRLQDFFSIVMTGRDVRTVLDEVYGIQTSDELFARSAKWYRAREAVKSVFWIAAILVVVAAVRGSRMPLVGSLQVLVAFAMILAVGTGLADHIYGLRGREVVLAAEVAAAALAAVLGLVGVRRIVRQGREQV
jgi:hypothetical protein